jgi:AraC-like DNA-binding protein
MLSGTSARLPSKTRLMPANGTRTFTDPDDYQAAFCGAKINLVFFRRGDFKARLTWVQLPNLLVLCSQENLPRVAYVSLMPDAVFVEWPVRPTAPPIWSGVELRTPDIVFHSLGERMHQRTNGASRSAFISLAPEYLAVSGKTLAGQDFGPLPLGRVLRPAASAARQLRRLHAKVCHLTETKPDVIANPQVARAMEHDLLLALVTCLIAEEAHGPAATMQHHADVMVRFEEMLTTCFDRQLQTSEMCAIIGVSERTLRICCAEFLGMGPSEYARLRRLNLVRAALRRADPAMTTVAQQARRCGFSELGRFAVLYRTVFGETPSTTLRRATNRDAAFAKYA